MVPFPIAGHILHDRINCIIDSPSERSLPINVHDCTAHAYIAMYVYT